jgi:muramidase (phage lysozyme)
MSERRNDDNDDEFDNTTTKFLYAFTQSVLNSDKSIRWVAITDQDGNIINEQNRREGFESLLTKEENQESAINTIIRQKTRTKFEPKIGKLSYALGRYQKLSRCLIPINENYYLILTMDFDQYDFDKIIMEKIIPLIQQEKEKFVINNKKNE